jgi:hypothetical protein
MDPAQVIEPVSPCVLMVPAPLGVIETPGETVACSLNAQTARLSRFAGDRF